MRTHSLITTKKIFVSLALSSLVLGQVGCNKKEDDAPAAPPAPPPAVDQNLNPQGYWPVGNAFPGVVLPETNFDICAPNQGFTQPGPLPGQPVVPQWPGQLVPPQPGQVVPQPAQPGVSVGFFVSTSYCTPNWYRPLEPQNVLRTDLPVSRTGYMYSSFLASGAIVSSYFTGAAPDFLVDRLAAKRDSSISERANELISYLRFYKNPTGTEMTLIVDLSGNLRPKQPRRRNGNRNDENNDANHDGDQRTRNRGQPVRAIFQGSRNQQDRQMTFAVVPQLGPETLTTYNRAELMNPKIQCLDVAGNCDVALLTFHLEGNRVEAILHNTPARVMVNTQNVNGPRGEILKSYFRSTIGDPTQYPGTRVSSFAIVGGISGMSLEIRRSDNEIFGYESYLTIPANGTGAVMPETAVLFSSLSMLKRDGVDRTSNQDILKTDLISIVHNNGLGQTQARILLNDGTGYVDVVVMREPVPSINGKFTGRNGNVPGYDGVSFRRQ